MPESETESVPKNTPRSSTRSRRRTRSGLGRKLLLVLSVSVPMLILVSYFGFKIWLNSYVHSAAFREQVSNQLSTKLRAQTDLDAISWEDRTVRVGKVTAAGYEKAAFSRLSVDDLRADMNVSLWDRVVEIPSVTVSRVLLDLSGNNRLKEPPPSPDSAENARNSSPGGSFLDQFKPNTVVFKEARINDLEIIARASDGEMRLSNLPLILRADPAGSAWSLESHPSDGRTQLVTNLAGGFRLKVTDLAARVHGDNFDLMELSGDLEKLRKSDSGKDDDLIRTRLSANGSVSTEGKHTSASLEALVNDLRLQDWVKDDWTKRLTGLADAKVRLAGDLDQPESLELHGVFALKRGVLQGLPLLEQLASRTKAQEFLRLELNTARCDFSSNKGEWHLDKIEVESRGLLKIEGYIALRADGNLQGLLQVGAAPGRLRAIDGAEQRVFTREENGYKWAVPPMRLWGSLDSVQEDLSGRIKDAWIDQQIENVTDLATQAPEKALDTSTKAAETGVKLLEEGMKQAPDLLDQGVRLFQGLLPTPQR